MNGKTVFFAIAALLGVLCSLSAFNLIWVFFIYLWFLFRWKHYRKWDVLLILIAFFIFFLSGHLEKSHNKSVIPNSTSNFQLEYVQKTKIDGDLLQVIAEEKRFQENVVVLYKIKSLEEKQALTRHSFFGVVCNISGDLKEPARAKNPNAFDYRKYLSTKKIFWVVESQTNPVQKCTPGKPSLVTLIKQLRFAGIQFLNQSPPEVASLSAALIFGDTDFIDPGTLSDYQRTGIVHLLAISGLHVALIVSMVFYIGLRLGATRQFMTNFLLVLLPIYAVLTGGSPSVIRSVLMIFVVLLTGKWKSIIKVFPIDAVSFALMLYLFIDPLSVYDIGFQLSFTVSVAIILSAPTIMKIHTNSLYQMIVISVISQLSAMPLLLYHYFEISIISLLANLLYIPLYSFVFLPSLSVLFLLNVVTHGFFEFLFSLFVPVIRLSNKILSLLANIPYSHLTLGRPNWFMLIVYLVLIFGIFCVWESRPYLHRNRHLIIMSVFLISFQFCFNHMSPFGEVTMIDVGQGDSFLIRLPFDKGTFLIDTGGTVSFGEEGWRERKKPFEVGRDIVVPYLKGKGITTIDKLILTHGDMDHIGGALSVLKEIRVKQILLPSVTDISGTEKLIMEEANHKKIPIVKVSEGSGWNAGTAFVYILSPEKNFTGNRNRGSIALYAKIGGLTWFFGGDLDQEGEKEILQKYPDLTVQVLKAGHHGSKTSSADQFINQMKPVITLISVGEKNRFGHPHAEVLEKLRAINSLIYRTDRQGAVTYRFFRDKGTFFAYLP